MPLMIALENLRAISVLPEIRDQEIENTHRLNLFQTTSGLKSSSKAQTKLFLRPVLRRYYIRGRITHPKRTRFQLIFQGQDGRCIKKYLIRTFPLMISFLGFVPTKDRTKGHSGAFAARYGGLQPFQTMSTIEPRLLNIQHLGQGLFNKDCFKRLDIIVNYCVTAHLGIRAYFNFT